MDPLPPEFCARMKDILTSSYSDDWAEGLRPHAVFAIRVNTLKSSINDIKETLKTASIDFKETALEEALLVSGSLKDKLMELESHKNGAIYLQNISSQLVSRILDPQAEESVLDMCAAPGSKTSHLAALMQNKGNVLALEKIIGRFHKLRSVLQLTGASQVEVKCLDAQRFRPTRSFDKILVDAPCSSEGRFTLEDPESFSYWSPRKIKEMRSKQKGILLRGAQLLKTNGTLVYSTCTFAPEENEEVVDWVLKKMDGKLETMPISLSGIPTYPALSSWRKRQFSKGIQHCIRIAPGPVWHGFFIAKFRKVS
jgi:NOL1/NOP2/sun family putative RNA methylase